MPAALAAPSDAKIRNRSIEARREARVANASRERLVIDLLNGGLPVAEIATRLGVTEKRTRAIVREILARRRPGAPEDYVALQISRLNEALLVAYGAMAGQNLRAVGLVVRIVRELDRYHGFVGAETRSLPDVQSPAAGADPGATPGVEKPFALLTRHMKVDPQATETACVTLMRAAEADGARVAVGRRIVEEAPDRGAADAPLAWDAPPAPETPRCASEIDGTPTDSNGPAASPAEPAQAARALDAPLLGSPQMALQEPEYVQNAPGNDGPRDVSDGGAASLAEHSDASDAPLTDSPQTAPQEPEIAHSAPGDSVAEPFAASAEESSAREIVTPPIETAPGAVADAPPSSEAAVNSILFRMLRFRMTQNGVSAC